ncbi:acetyltransferase (GNAT) family protein [Neolewinella xylanilytica]|uniref:Acetyltransferase (GNAT) family protein n=1 Tax=Neolewinella xylanilytica TaxID=1514080 RepID=A0A2S6I5A0_9BACT|nr:GNAT family N-acetyltransferase [Neolewinella xylanilytica]PPK86353.1 acetyltransferase (GNAT) family protein [Neolewinella xylanilytica]
MIRLLQPARREIAELYRSATYRGFPLEEDAIPSRVIVDQAIRTADTSDLGYRWSVPFLILFEPTACIAGSIGGKGLLEGEEEVELGYNVALNYRRKGIATRAIGQMCALAKADALGLLAHVETGNHPSRRALLHNGFVLDEIVRLPASLDLERWTWSAD